MKDGRIDLEDSAKETGYADVRIAFNEEQTENLVRRAGKAFNTEINDLLISAIGMSVRGVTGQAKVAIGLEGHGREEIHKKMDIDRTVGWFTIKYPIVVECHKDIRRSIVSTKDMVRKVPAHGLGYGLLHELQEISADIYFNYLGQMDTESNAAFFSTGKSTEEENGISGTIDMNGYIVEGKLSFLVRYDRSRFSAETIERFTTLYQQYLIESIAYCCAQERTAKTASDYSANDLTSMDLSVLHHRFADPNEMDDIYSLTSLQEGILYHNIADGESTDYVTQIVYAFNGETEEAIIKQALKLLVMRHDVVRTAIIHEQLSKPRQILVNNRQVEYEKIDLSGLGKLEQEKKVAELAGLNLHRGFDLQHDSLLRVKYLVLSPTDRKIIWSYHHIIFDGWSTNMLFGDFVAYCNHLSNGRSMSDMERMVAEEKNQTAAYGEYVDWIEQQDRELGLSYWDELLADYDETAEIKPLMKPEPTEKQMERIGMQLSDETTKKLLQTAVSHQITINTIAESALGIVLQQYSGAKDVVFGKVVSGRNADVRGIENIVGLFVNTIPTRLRSRDDTTVSELWKELQEQGTESDQYSYCSLADIQRLTKQKGDLIKVLYAFENYYVNEEKMSEEGGLQFVMEAAREQTNYAITLSAYLSGDHLVFDVLYNPNHYVMDEIQSILARIQTVLLSARANPEGAVSAIETITEPEKVQILGEFNETTSDYPRDKTVVDLLEEQVRKFPEKTAVVFGDEQLTYAVLNQKANQLAGKLRELGVKPDDFVAIMAERRIETIIGICGILKAGGAYVPIDPTNPQERIDYILQDSKPKALLAYDAAYQTELPVVDLSEAGQWEGVAENIPAVNQPNDLIYVIYTSGTTGKPKGVMVEHKSVIRLVQKTNYVNLNENTVILQTGALSFDASTFEIWERC